MNFVNAEAWKTEFGVQGLAERPVGLGFIVAVLGIAVAQSFLGYATLNPKP